MRQTVATRVSAPATELDRILREGLLQPAFQPIVELETGEVAGYEALARVCGDSPLARPDLLFDAARAHGRVVELDWACRAAALRTAVEHGLRRALFLNSEPEAVVAPPADDVLPLLARAEALFQPVLELTERELTEHPGAILGLLPTVRERGVRFALDDVGVDPRSLALMPFVRPEVIKFDLALTQAPLTPELAETVHAVNAHAERRGTMVVAEGIETEEHALRARALGATHGQGWFYGRPGPLPAEARTPVKALPLPAPLDDDGDQTPFEVLREAIEPRTAPKRLLLALSRQLEAHAEGLGHAGVLLATFQDRARFTGASRARYEHLGRRLAFVGALGAGLEHHAARGVRGADLPPGDPLRGEWDVCVVGPHFAAAFVARDLGDAGPDADRRFAHIATFDRELVLRVARRLMARAAPLS